MCVCVDMYVSNFVSYMDTECAATTDLSCRFCACLRFIFTVFLDLYSSVRVPLRLPCTCFLTLPTYVTNTSVCVRVCVCVCVCVRSCAYMCMCVCARV